MGESCVDCCSQRVASVQLQQLCHSRWHVVLDVVHRPPLTPLAHSALRVLIGPCEIAPPTDAGDEVGYHELWKGQRHTDPPPPGVKLAVADQGGGASTAAAKVLGAEAKAEAEAKAQEVREGGAQAAGRLEATVAREGSNWPARLREALPARLLRMPRRLVRKGWTLWRLPARSS